MVFIEQNAGARSRTGQQRCLCLPAWQKPRWHHRPAWCQRNGLNFLRCLAGYGSN